MVSSGCHACLPPEPLHRDARPALTSARIVVGPPATGVRKYGRVGKRWEMGFNKRTKPPLPARPNLQQLFEQDIHF